MARSHTRSAWERFVCAVGCLDVEVEPSPANGKRARRAKQTRTRNRRATPSGDCETLVPSSWPRSLRRLFFNMRVYRKGGYSESGAGRERGQVGD